MKKEELHLAKIAAEKWLRLMLHNLSSEFMGQAGSTVGDEKERQDFTNKDIQEVELALRWVRGKK